MLICYEIEKKKAFWFTHPPLIFERFQNILLTDKL